MPKREPTRLSSPRRHAGRSARRGKHPYLRTTYRRNVLLVSRLLYHLGAASRTPTIAAAADRYLRVPVADDDPYRYYRW